jgi:hypothetical protein
MKKERTYLFIKTEDSQSIEINATSYKQAEKYLEKMIKQGDLAGGQWRYDSCRQLD